MQGLKSSALCLLASLSGQAQAEAPPQIKVELTQLTNTDCAGSSASSKNILSSGDCITYRITVENIGGGIAHNVEVSALIPKYTELYQPIRDIKTHEALGTIVEHKADGSGIVKAALDVVPAGTASQIVLEYSVRVI